MTRRTAQPDRRPAPTPARWAAASLLAAVLFWFTGGAAAVHQAIAHSGDAAAHAHGEHDHEHSHDHAPASPSDDGAPVSDCPVCHVVLTLAAPFPPAPAAVAAADAEPLLRPSDRAPVLPSRRLTQASPRAPPASA